MTSSSVAVRCCVVALAVSLCLLVDRCETISQSNCFLGDVDISLQPVDPAIEVGGVLELTCSILELYSGSLNSSFLYFKNGNVNYTSSSPLVFVIDEKRAMLRIRNVSYDHLGHYYCILPGAKCSSSQSVIVERRPLVPEVTGCVVESWKKLVCSWQPSGAEQANHIGSERNVETQFQWSHSGERGNFSNCTLAKRHISVTGSSESCQLPDEADTATITGEFPSGQVCARVVVNNSIKIPATSPVWCRDVRSIVRLEKPTVSLQDLKETHVVLQLKPPDIDHDEKPSFTFVYNVTYKSQWSQNITSVEVVDVGSNATVTLTTTPFTTYDVKVSVKLLGSDMWSRPYQLPPFTTLQDEPHSSPEMTRSAFVLERVEDKPDLKVALYWKQLPAMYYHGTNFRYKVLLRKIVGKQPEDVWSFVKSPEANMSSTTFKVLPLTESEMFELAVVANNSVGQTSPGVTVTVSSDFVDVITWLSASVNDANVSVFWKAASEFSSDIQSFTLYWCRSGLVERGIRQCRGELNWRQIPRDVGNFTHTLPKYYSDHMFGVSADLSDGIVSSGIKWAKCVHQHSGEAKPPRDVKAIVGPNSEYGQIQVQWNQPEACNNGLVLWYTIYYCQLNRDGDCSQTRSVNVSGDYSSWNLTGLSARYMVWLTSTTVSGLVSARSENSTAVPTAHWATAGVIAAIVIGSLLVLITTGCLLYHCCRKWSKYTHGIQIQPPSMKNSHGTQDSVSVSFSRPNGLRGFSNGSHLSEPLISRDQPSPSPITIITDPSLLDSGRGDTVYFVSTETAKSLTGFGPQTSESSDVDVHEDASSVMLLSTTTKNSDIPDDLGGGVVPALVDSPSSQQQPPPQSDPPYIVVGPDATWCLSDLSGLTSPTSVGQVTREPSTGDHIPRYNNGHVEPVQLSAADRRRLPDVCCTSPTVAATPPTTCGDVQSSPATAAGNSSQQSVPVPTGVVFLDSLSPATAANGNVNGGCGCDRPSSHTDSAPVSNYSKIAPDGIQLQTPADDVTALNGLELVVGGRCPAAQPINGFQDSRFNVQDNASFQNGGFDSYVRHDELLRQPAAAVVDS